MNTDEIILWILGLCFLFGGAYIFYDVTTTNRKKLKELLLRTGLTEYKHKSELIDELEKCSVVSDAKERYLEDCYSGIFEGLETYICTAVDIKKSGERIEKTKTPIVIQVLEKPIEDFTIFRHSIGEKIFYRVRSLDMSSDLEDISVSTDSKNTQFVEELQSMAKRFMKAGYDGIELKDNRIIYSGGWGNFHPEYFEQTLLKRTKMTKELEAALS